MSSEELIEVLQNQQTGKYFVLLEEGLDDEKVRVINPEGNILTIPSRIFNPDPILISSNEINGQISEAQLQQLERYNSQFSRYVDAKKAAAQQSDSHKGSTTRSSDSRKSSQVKSSHTRGKVVSSWSCERLTFYKHKIDPLRDNDQFTVTVDGAGTFVMTKLEFQSAFNSVIMDLNYRANGIYTFDAIPEYAQKFRRL